MKKVMHKLATQHNIHLEMINKEKSPTTGTITENNETTSADFTTSTNQFDGASRNVDVIENNTSAVLGNYDNFIQQQLKNDDGSNSLRLRNNNFAPIEICLPTMSAATAASVVDGDGDSNDDKNAEIGDVAIVLDESKTEDVALVLAAALKSRKPGLVVQVRALKHCQALLVSATTKALLEWAEDFRLVKRERASGHLRTFVLNQYNQFEMNDSPDQFFSRQEKQRLIKLAIESVRAVDEVETFGTKNVLHGQPILGHLMLDGTVRHLFPLHSHEELKTLRKQWVASPINIRQPLDEISSYFDCSIGFYFAWLEFYTRWLFLPAIFGFFVWLFSPNSNNNNNNTDEPGSHIPNSSMLIMLIAFNTVWFALFQKFWTRKSSELAFQWGAVDHRDTSDKYFVEPRPLFTGTPAVNPVTGKATLFWPAWRRNVIFYFVSVPVSLVCLCLMMCASVFCLRFQKYAGRVAPLWPPPIDIAVNLAPLVLFVLVLNFFNNASMSVAIKLNDLENYFSQNDYVKQLQAKCILFRFLNGFLPLFYTAFYERDFEALQEQVAALVMIRQVASNAVEVLLPYLQARYQQFSLQNRDAKIADKANHLLKVTANNLQPFILIRRNRRTGGAATTSNCAPVITKEQPKQKELLSQVENEVLMPEFDDCFEDYLEMFSQLGYIMLFSVAFPPAAFWCLINNLVEIKTDALKMCTVCRRPFARERVRDIGIWTDAFKTLAIVAVVFNVALVANFDVANSSLQPSKTNSTALIGVVIVEHVIFGLRVFANHIVDDVPAWIHLELAKREYAQITASSSSSDHNKDQ